MKRAAMILVLLMLFLQFSNVAYAGQNLVSNSVENLTGTYSNGQVTLSWSSYIQDYSNNLIFGKPATSSTNVITIYRSDDPNTANTPSSIINQIGHIDVNEKVDNIDLQPDMHKMIGFEFTDTNVVEGTTYYYRVSCGSVSSTWQTVSVTAQGQSSTGTDNTSEKRKQYEQQADYPERLAGSIVMAIPNYAMKVLGLYDPLELIFQTKVKKNDTSSDSLKDLKSPDIVNETNQNNIYFYTYTKNEFGAIATYYDRLQNFIPLSLVQVVVLMGMALLFNSVNPNSKLTLKEMSIGFIVGMVIIKFGVYVLSVIFDIGHMFVNIFKWVVGDSLDASFLDTLINTDTMTLGQAIVAFLSIFSIGIINWQYALRKIIIGILIGLLPYVAVISIIPSRRSALNSWFKEFISQVALQPADAAALSFGILLIHANANFWIEIACIMGLPTMAILVRRVMGAESFGSGVAGGVGTMLGLGSLFALGKILSPKRSPMKFASDSLPGAMESASGVGTAAAGGIGGNSGGSLAGKLIGFGLRTGTALTAGVVGGMMTGAATGNPAFGIAGGMTMGSLVGGGIADAAGKAVSLYKMSPEQRINAMGVADPAMLDDPGEAYAASKRLLGDNIVGKAAGAGYAGFKSAQAFFGASDPSIATAAKKTIGESRAGLATATQQLADYKPAYDNAKANFGYAKNMYGPKSSNMMEMKERVQTLDAARGDVEVGLNQAVESQYSQPVWKVRSAVEDTINKYQDFARVDDQYQQVRGEVETGENTYNTAKKKMELSEAQLAQRQMQVSSYQQRLTTSGIKKEFEKLRQQPDQSGGGIEGAWR